LIREDQYRELGYFYVGHATPLGPQMFAVLSPLSH
jgi:hypothetical protein